MSLKQYIKEILFTGIFEKATNEIRNMLCFGFDCVWSNMPNILIALKFNKLKVCWYSNTLKETQGCYEAVQEANQIIREMYNVVIKFVQ